MNSSRAASFARGPPSWWAAGGGAEVTVALPLLLSGACLLSLSGNLLLLAALVSELRRGKLSPAHALVLNLCAADLLLALYCLPARVAAYARRSWPLGGFVCRTTDWLVQGCLVAKSLTWAAAGRARYRRHVAASPTCPGGGSRRRLAAILASLWAAALLLALPHLLFARVEAAPGTGLRSCALLAPPGAARFMDVFSKLYPALACLAPSGFACWCAWRALRAQREERRKKKKRKKKKRKIHRLVQAGGPPSATVTRRLLALGLLFHAMWLPEWVLWLWERHSGGPPASTAPPPPPPAALGFAAELLLFLNGSLSPGLFLAVSEELREGLRRSVWRSCAKEETDGAPARPQPLQELRGEAAEKVLPDVEHFWKDRRNTVAGEESDPVPWEHQSDP